MDKKIQLELKLNKYLLCLIATFFFCISTAHAEQNRPDKTVLQFFNASRHGDVEKMRELVSGSYYNRRKAVLENNDAYPAFLKKHFQGSSTTIERSNIDKDKKIAVVTVTTRFKNLSIDTSRLVLKKDENGFWRIVDEKLPLPR